MPKTPTIWSDKQKISQVIPVRDKNLAKYTICTYNYPMNYEWDPWKASGNLRKHQVDFADAVIALQDENALTIEDSDHEEQRFKTLGMGPYSKVLFVVHAEQRKNCIRIISARRARRKEIEQYYKGL